MLHLKPLCWCLLCLCLMACQKQIVVPDDALFTPVPNSEVANLWQQFTPQAQGLQSWQDLSLGIQYSLDYAKNQNPDQVVVADANLSITWAAVVQSLLTMQTILPRLDAEPELLVKHFSWYKFQKPAQFSGYYEPLFAASKIPTAEYQHPVYKLPPDLKVLDLGNFNIALVGQRLSYRLDKNQPVPYYTRQEIDGQKVLAHKNLELAWLKSPVDAYFLHVQGSGRLQYSDGTQQAIGYAGKNGYTYTSIGGYLSGQGHIAPDQLSMQSIRSWLNANPQSLNQVLQQNKSYVFFQFPKNPARYPQGSIARPLTPWVSLAVDRTSFPLGSLLAFQTRLPQAEAQTKPFSGLGLAQDTGSAIKYNRLDLFCGQGSEAEFVAGHLNSPGDVWILLAK